MNDTPTPHGVYTARLATRQAQVAALVSRDRLLSYARFAVLLVAAGTAWGSWRLGAFSPGWLLAPGLVFAGLAVYHGHVVEARRRLERAVRFYEDGLARIEERWHGRADGGATYASDDHLYAADLDLFGPRSLFELLNTTRTQAGADRLATWLREPASPEVIRSRQQAIAELRPALDLRERLHLTGAETWHRLHPRALATWGAGARVLANPTVGWVAAILALAMVVATAGWWAGLWDGTSCSVILLAEAIVALPVRQRVRRAVHDIGAAAHELSVLGTLLSQIERLPATAPHLVALQRSLDTAGLPPSRRIRQLSRLVNALDARRNQLFAPIAYLLMWGTICAHAIETWRATSGPAIERWLDAVGEFEALSALATYTYEHPADPFPTVVPATNGPCVVGTDLGHPLLPVATCTRNSVNLVGGTHGDGPRVLVVSGSNMSGKSTWLRTVGINVVLALAGAPVRASALTVTPVAIGGTLRIQDSLQGGISRFYAEITRLRAIVSLTDGPLPPLVLLDELLNGTNSHDRGVGAAALLRGLIDRGAIGLVTTHDLSLSALADTLAPQAANVHFEDHLEDGVMRFDYRCRPGVMAHSNALALMRAVGLQV